MESVSYWRVYLIFLYLQTKKYVFRIKTAIDIRKHTIFYINIENLTHESFSLFLSKLAHFTKNLDQLSVLQNARLNRHQVLYLLNN